MRRILTILCLFVASILTAGCDVYTHVSAPDATINVTAPVRSRPAVPDRPTVSPDATEPGSTDLMDPPSDTDVPFNGGELPDVVTPDPDHPAEAGPCQDSPGRGGGNGTPGNGRGRGDEQRSCAR